MTPGNPAPTASPPRDEEGPRTFGFAIHLGLWVAALIGAAIVAVIGRTYRIRVVAGQDILERLVAEPQPVLLTFWHNQSFFIACFVNRFLFRRGFPVTILASHSRDGELVARIGRLLGFEAVRGSASRGGRNALRRLYRVITTQGSSPITIPDGPRGPIYKCKPGIVVLAQMSGAPFLPLAFEASRAWRLRSWDRLIVPRPFTRLSVAIGDPFSVRRDLSSDELEAEARRVERALAAVNDAARSGAADGGT